MFWIGFVIALGGSCLALFMSSFSWEDSHPTQATQTNLSRPALLVPSVPPVNDFSVPAGIEAKQREGEKLDPADADLLKRFGPDDSKLLPLRSEREGSVESALVPAQSAKH